jgi:NAD-dependent SIR2 family protein deacetylase
MINQLVDLLNAGSRLVVLTGAGLSAPSGIPTYRDDGGAWRRSDPIQHRDFVERPEARQRYWARSMAGWPAVAAARPNGGHRALAQLEAAGHVELLVTQNVDRLHQRAGHQRVIDLHGRLDRVVCLGCGDLFERSAIQEELESLNPAYRVHVAEARPDGDAEVEDRHVRDIRVPDCEDCGGTLMPDVVFFGGTVPRDRVEDVNSALQLSDGLLVVGSSLMVYSGFRFARAAHAAGKPLVIINRGRTRADDLGPTRIATDCTTALQQLVDELALPLATRSDCST